MSINIQRLKESRENLGISQRELARKCGIADVLIYRYESGISLPATKNLIAIAATLNVSLDYLAGLSDNPQGQLGDKPLSSEENNILETFRHEGWPGVFRLGAERISK